MGASQSTVESATDMQLKEVGPFTLRSQQKTAIKVLGDIFKNLIDVSGNNLFNLAELLTSPEKCGNLFVIVSSTVKKEFSLLKFPDPRNPSHMATLSFLPRGNYPPASPDSKAARDRACNEITHFLIRLVTLAAACTASISRNENIAGLLSVVPTSEDTSGVARLIRDLPSGLTFSTPPLDENALRFLSTSSKPAVAGYEQKGIFNQVDKSGRPNLYRFGQTTTYIVDIRKGVIYDARSPSTPVFRISMELLTGQRPIGDIERAVPAVGYQVGFNPALMPSAVLPIPQQPMAPAVAPITQVAPVAPVAPVPGASGSVVSFNAGASQRTSNPGTNAGASAFGVPRGGRRCKTRRGTDARRRRATRRRPIYGGAEASYVKCTIEEIPFGDFRTCETESYCQKIIFIIDAEGNTYDYEIYEQFQKDPSRPVSGTRKDFGPRVEEIFSKIITHKITTEPYRESTELSKDTYKAIKGASAETLETFQKYYSSIASLETGSAPAPYRGFMLASRLAGPELTTAFCADKWAGQFTTATLPYALLQALYDDGIAGTAPSPRAADACRAAAREFTGAQVAVSAAAAGSEIDSFRNIKFAPIPPSLSTFCGEQYPQRTSSQNDKSLLIATQREIRKLYDAHISAMVGIVKKVFSLSTDPAVLNSMLFTLDERFTSDPAGGLVALEKIIEEARTIISRHYLEVEKKYNGALLQLGRFRRGVTAINNPAVASNALESVAATL